MEKVDIDKLEREMLGALRADRKYSRENDAKFRAVSQRVQTYEEFRDIVKASHLMPLDRKEWLDSRRNQPWNSVAQGASKLMGENLTAESDTSPTNSASRVSNVQEFTREWRRLKKLPKLHQYQFLLNIGGVTIYELFKVEISMGLLGEFLLTLSDAFQDSDVTEVVGILDSLSRTSRFSLSVKFLSQKELQAAGELFKKLAKAREGEDESSRTLCDSIRKLAKQYNEII